MIPIHGWILIRCSGREKGLRFDTFIERLESGGEGTKQFRDSTSYVIILVNSAVNRMRTRQLLFTVFKEVLNGPTIARMDERFSDASIDVFVLGLEILALFLSSM